MKNIIFILSLYLFGCNINDTNNQLVNLSKKHVENLEYIVKNLKEDIPNYSYKLSSEEGFIIDSTGIIGVNIYDLNTGESLKGDFKNGHVYHISPINFQDSFSYILCVYENKLVLFKSVNCKGMGNKIEEVIDYINSNFSKNTELQGIIFNVKNYRKFGVYLRTDTMTTLKCNCEPCE